MTRRVGPTDDDDDDDDNGQTDDRWLDLNRLARHSSLSVRTLQRYLHAAEHPLPHHHVGGRVLVSRREFDAWVRDTGRAASGDPRDTSWVRRAFGK